MISRRAARCPRRRRCRTSPASAASRRRARRASTSRPRRDTPAPSSKRSTGAHSPSRRSRLRVTRELASPVSDLVLPFRVVVPLRAPAASHPRPAPGRRPRPAPSSCGRPCLSGAPAPPIPRGARESTIPRLRQPVRIEVPQPVAVAPRQLRREGWGTSATDRVGVRCAPSPRRRRRPPPPPPPLVTRPGTGIRGRSGDCDCGRRRRRSSPFCYRRPSEVGWRSTREGGLMPGPQEGHEIEQVNQRPQPALGPYSPFGDGDEGALSS